VSAYRYRFDTKVFAAVLAAADAVAAVVGSADGSDDGVGFGVAIGAVVATVVAAGAGLSVGPLPQATTRTTITATARIRRDSPGLIGDIGTLPLRCLGRCGDDDG